MIRINNKVIEFGRFPNEELNLKLDSLDEESPVGLVEFIFENNDDLIKLALTKELLDLKGVLAALYIVYMPYSRMDRSNGHYVKSLEVICKFINSLNFYTVTVREPHSPETTRLLNNSSAHWWCEEQIGNIVSSESYDSIFFPDYGAKERYKNLWKYDTGYGKKERDFLTGNIKGLSILGTVGTRVLIVDDLCSRGGTFVESAKQLKNVGTKSVGLLVAYVEHNVFTGDLFDYVDRVYTSKDIVLTDHPRITKI